MTLNKVPLALTGTSVKFRATIKNIPELQKVLWMKGNQRININDLKYEGSTETGDNPVLCIKNIILEDSDMYRIKVENQLGTEQCRQRLEVIEGKINPYGYQMISHGIFLGFNVNFHC